ncbi:MAG: Na+/H+ antiporter subunit E [Methylobacterium mesophilicum]|nr:Na+/H+ antiporter subunit E [Methylobacterium mesophilicum]
MSRILPHPLLSLLLLVLWVVLDGSLVPTTVLTGVLLGLALPFAMNALEPPPARVRAPGAILRLGGMVLVDILRSNYAVARIILSRGRRERVSGFITLQLTLRSPYALAALAVIVTSTPGTLWVQYDAGSGRLLMHVLDLVDESTWQDLIANRYERLLKEIFE